MSVQSTASPKSFDVARYVGKWLDVQHIPNAFQSATTRNVTAEYKLTADEDGQTAIIVRNEQTKLDGTREGITGMARICDETPPDTYQQLTVSFFGSDAQSQAAAYTQDNPDAPPSKRLRDYLSSPSLLWGGLLARVSNTFVRPNYVIYALGQENGSLEPYTWALVGSPDRSKGWVLARTTSLSCATWKAVRSEMREHGFNENKFVLTGHVCF